MARLFLDTSALVKRYHPEAGTAVVDRLADDPANELVISRLTLVEATSVFAVKTRTGEIPPGGFERLRKLLASHVARGRYRVARMRASHYARAQRLIRDHGTARQIRTLDALQLAVALELHWAAPLDSFVCADQRLCNLAAGEGLAVLNPEASP
ncbi:type II toxin-antitoxin system VapC family toxin [Paludisphaera sp.]|uniref:type II toxin-antitoxin system VapC family toxin n=1 Tax=Paludisphaera sp. TaxID=2017432 RepID=UPI00301DA738